MTALAWAEIHLPALTHNALQLLKLSPQAQFIAVIKANAYGHGAVEVARQLSPLVQMFAVARIEEAEALKQANITQAITVLSGCYNQEALERCLDLDILPCVYNVNLLKDVNLRPTLNYWLMVNSGMNRLGLNAIEANAWLEQCTNKPFGIMSHFSSADESGAKTPQQMQVMHGFAKHYPVSLANSAGISYWPDSHHQWVRAGIALYGISPSEQAHCLDLQAVMQFKARIIQVAQVADGQAVGYGERYRCQGERSIATLAVGYADGYPRHAPDGTPVLINGKLCPIAGKVSMDLITVDVTALQGGVQVGDIATLWGQGIACETIAKHCDTIAYELVSKVTARVPRLYL